MAYEHLQITEKNCFLQQLCTLKQPKMKSISFFRKRKNHKCIQFPIQMQNGITCIFVFCIIHICIFPLTLKILNDSGYIKLLALCVYVLQNTLTYYTNTVTSEGNVWLLCCIFLSFRPHQSCVVKTLSFKNTMISFYLVV